MKPTVEIRDWIFVYKPQSNETLLFGVPKNHPSPTGLVSNKKMIVSSPVVCLPKHCVVETQNTQYVLIGDGISPQELQRRLNDPAATYN